MSVSKNSPYTNSFNRDDHASEHAAMGVGVSVVAGELEILPTNDATMWSTDKSAAVTVTVDTAVTFNGRPTLRIDIPAGTSGTIKVGTNTANARVPYNWDRNNFAIAIKSTNYSLASGVSCYLGDSGYANFYLNSLANSTNFPQQKIRTGEWWITKSAASNWTTGGGAPAVASLMRAKIQFTASASASNESMWIGLFGVMPARKKPTIIFTLDDGYASWYSFIRPLFKHYDLPVSMGVSSALVGTANYLTAAQVVSLFEDSSRLFDIVNHSTNNSSYTDVGASAYYANVVTCRDYLRGLGITGDGPLHHPLVQSVWGNDLVDLLSAGGFLTSRASAWVAEDAKDQLLPVDKLRWHLNICTNLQAGKSVAQAITDVTAVTNAGGFGMVNAHDFAAADAAYVYSYDNMEQFVGQIAAQRDAGTIEVKSWSKWYADITGRSCDRR